LSVSGQFDFGKQIIFFKSYTIQCAYTHTQTHMHTHKQVTLFFKPYYMYQCVCMCAHTQEVHCRSFIWKDL